jgi:hypothetical protein
MRVPRIVAVAISTLPLADAAIAQDEASSDTIVLDGVLIAFYEVAPRRLAASMRRAVVAECARKREGVVDPNVEKARRWLCDATTDTYFRSVDVQGRGTVIGCVCEGDWALKYSANNMVRNAVESAECVDISYGGVANAHILELSRSKR